MTPRERVMKAINHEKVDRIPLDLGGTVNSSIVEEAYAELKRQLGFPAPDTKLINKMMRVVEVEKDILNYFNIDTRGIFPGEHSKVETVDSKTYIDEWGVKRVKKENIFYYEQLDFPLSGEITKNDILKYDWPDPDDKNITNNLRNQISQVKKEGDYAIVLTIPSPFIHKSQYLRGFEDWYLDCAANVKIINLLFDCIFNITLKMTENILSEAGQEIDVVMFSDDLGTQNNLQFSPDFFRKNVKPRFKKYIKVIKSLCSKNTKILFHSCGSIGLIMEDLIEIGVDAINPVQITARGMEPKKLKEKYGENLCFWGAIDTQKILSQGTNKEVKEEVKRIIKILGKEGGYILGAVHNIQPDVPGTNIITMFKQACSINIKDSE